MKLAISTSAIRVIRQHGIIGGIQLTNWWMFEAKIEDRTMWRLMFAAIEFWAIVNECIFRLTLSIQQSGFVNSNKMSERKPKRKQKMLVRMILLCRRLLLCSFFGICHSYAHTLVTAVILPPNVRWLLVQMHRSSTRCCYRRVVISFVFLHFIFCSASNEVWIPFRFVQ